eukprot:CAMPEP_0185760714 /NCGR_PEP_ID=MMETSP1174-20130828/19618_1 /TAXON_ID=35687 /ORGANISM="Dictyocha speculum, Strain CCMP1381" /LENGTH=236 /DNA_ID=CAMNT_0028441641 /DNA_START=68 /DNA_END=778 /DNA_ORIENTATION=-
MKEYPQDSMGSIFVKPAKKAPTAVTTSALQDEDKDEVAVPQVNKVDSKVGEDGAEPASTAGGAPGREEEDREEVMAVLSGDDLTPPPPHSTPSTVASDAVSGPPSPPSVPLESTKDGATDGVSGPPPSDEASPPGEASGEESDGADGAREALDEPSRCQSTEVELNAVDHAVGPLEMKLELDVQEDVIIGGGDWSPERSEHSNLEQDDASQQIDETVVAGPEGTQVHETDTTNTTP